LQADPLPAFVNDYVGRNLLSLRSIFRQQARIDFVEHILASHGLEINHGRCQIAVAQPELKRANVTDAFL